MFKKSPMRLTKLEIERARYGSDTGKLKGRAWFDSDNAGVMLNLKESHVQKIMDMCADSLLEAAQDMAEVMRNDVIEGVTTEKRIGKSP